MAIETTTLIQIIAGGGTLLTAIGALITALRTNKRIKVTKAEEDNVRASAAQKIVDAAADQVQVIRDEAERARGLLLDEREESEKLKNECILLRGEVSALGKRVEENHTCQTKLTWQLEEQQTKLEALEDEKKKLMGRIVELEDKIKELQDENKRLKEERENEKQVIT